MTRHLVFSALLVLTACRPLLPTAPTVPPGERRVEDTPLPPDPKDLPVVLPEGGDSTEWTESIEVGQHVDRAGILISEGYAGRVALFKIGYKELRTYYEADRSVWRAHRDLYETRLRLGDVAIQELQPSWWDNNKFSLGVMGGFVVGTAVVLGVLALTN